MPTQTRDWGVPLFLGGTIAFSLLLFFGMDHKNAAIIVGAAILAFNFYRRPRELLIPGLIALGFAMFITNVNHYVYAESNIFIGMMNLYTLVMWTAGLLLTREIYRLIAARFPYPLITSVLLYWVILFTLEYVAYYWLGIQTTAGNPSFLGTGVLHGTPIMHIFYPSAGPVFIIITYYLEKWLPRADNSLK